MNKVIEDLNWRYAVKEFDATKKLTREQMDTILESLRLSASSFGLQPWKFVIVEDQSLKEKLVEFSWNQRQVADAAELIVLCAPARFDVENVDLFIKDIIKTRNVEPESVKGYGDMMKGFLSRLNDESKRAWIKDQIYIALGQLLSTCAALRIDSCPMEGFMPDKYTEVLGLADKGLLPIVVCPIGYRSDNDKYAELKKVRYPIEDVVVRI